MKCVISVKIALKQNMLNKSRQLKCFLGKDF